jgi:hypothetical protein
LVIALVIVLVAVLVLVIVINVTGVKAGIVVGRVKVLSEVNEDVVKYVETVVFVAVVETPVDVRTMAVNTAPICHNLPQIK